MWDYQLSPNENEWGFIACGARYHELYEIFHDGSTAIPVNEGEDENYMKIEHSLEAN